MDRRQLRVPGEGTEEGRRHDVWTEQPRLLWQTEGDRTNFTGGEETQGWHVDSTQTVEENGPESRTWYERGAESVRATRITADPMNINPRLGWLEIRWNLFTVRVINDWNRIPAGIKQKPNKTSFKAAYAKCREKTTNPVARLTARASRMTYERGVPRSDVLHSGPIWPSENDSTRT
jgi:hypothetical protein